MSYKVVNILPNSHRLPQSLYWVSDSGKIVYRKKINTLMGIDHPGIILGEDEDGYLWVMHHHYMNIYPTVERVDRFSLGEMVYYDPRHVDYGQREIVERAISHWIERREYNWLWQNCQHFVNGIAQDDHYSEAIDAASNSGLIAAGVLGLLGLATKNKSLVELAIGTAVVSGTAKVLNRVRVTPSLPANRSLASPIRQTHYLF